jgi:hypothetical protein
MAKEITEGLKNQKILIKDVINPFFKGHGFLRTGVNYIKKLDYFIIQAEIQRQRYYKDDGVENFRINVRVYSENSYKLFYGSMAFGGYCIQGENSWITTDENTNIDKLKLWLNIELNKLPNIFEEYNDVEKIIEKQKEIGNNYGYAFLLKDNNKTKEFEQWNKDINHEIEKINMEIIASSKKLEIIENDRHKTIENNTEYKKLWSERKSNQMKIEGIMNFLKKINK